MKKNIWIWFAAILFAILLWLQSVFLSDQEEIVEIPIRIENLSPELIINDPADQTIGVILKTKGINVIIFHNQEIEYVINGDQLKYGTNSIHLSLKKLVGSNRVREFVTGFESDVKMLEIDRIVTERKPVIFAFKNIDEEKYFQNHPLDKSKAEVKISGASKILAGIEGIKTEKINRSLFKNNELRLRLIKPSKDVKLLTDEIKVSLAAESQQIKTIPLVPVNFPSDLGFSISPQKVTVKVSGKKSLLNKITRDDIRIDLSANDSEIYGKLQFNLPEGVTLMEHTPEKIRIIR